MTARSTTLRFPEGTKAVGTARVREDRTVGRGFAERELMRRTGNQPHSEFDEIADGPIALAVKKAAQAASMIGNATALEKPIARMVKPTAPSNTGSPNARIGRRLINPIANFWSKVDKSGGPDACWPWIAKSRYTSGYGCIRFDFGSGIALRGSHQVSFFLSMGRVPGTGLEVLHSCDNKPCCNPKHLSEGTHSRNMEEAYARGRLKPKRRKGVEAPSARLTEAQVTEIRRRAERGAPLGQLASEYGLSKPGIHHVISGRTWRHVEPVTSKYGNVRTVVDGKTFDSKREANRYMQLLALQQRGEITDLELQVPFVLAPAVVLDGRKKTELRYVADFVYERNGETVIEDVKGKVTPEYRIKRHLMAARGLFITEIK